MRVLKYPLKVMDEQVLDLPVSGYEILSIEEQNEQIVLYAKVPNEPSGQTIPVKIYIHGTGHVMHPRASQFLGTAKMYGGKLMFHVFCEYNRRSLS